jgi:hypothetical protein
VINNDARIKHGQITCVNNVWVQRVMENEHAYGRRKPREATVLTSITNRNIDVITYHE